MLVEAYVCVCVGVCIAFINLVFLGMCVRVCVFMIDVVQSIGIQFIMYIKGMKGIFLYDGLNWSGDLHTHTHIHDTYTHSEYLCILNIRLR